MSLISLLFFFVRNKKDITEFLVIAVVIYLGSVHIRHGVIFGLVFGAYMPLYLSEYAKELHAKRHSFKYLIGILSVIFSSLMMITYFYFYSVKQITFIPSFKFFNFSCLTGEILN